MPKDTKGTPGTGHNSQEREASIIRHMTVLRPLRDAVEDAKALVKKAQKDFTVARNAAKSDGWTLKLIDKALKVETQQNRQEQQDQANEEHFIFVTLGLPVALVQGDLFDTDEKREERNEAFWSDHGYNTGLKGLPATPPAEMAPQYLQTWLQRRVAGVERLAWAQAEQEVNPEKGAAKAGTEGVKVDADDKPAKGDKTKDPLLQ
jgi:hypothetical protein